MKEKSLATSFFAANLADVVSTAVALRVGMHEVGKISRPMVESGNEAGFYLLKMGVTAGLIGIYLLSQKKGGWFGKGMDISLRISNIIVWSTAALNTAQIAGVMMGVIR